MYSRGPQKTVADGEDVAPGSAALFAQNAARRCKSRPHSSFFERPSRLLFAGILTAFALIGCGGSSVDERTSKSPTLLATSTANNLARHVFSNARADYTVTQLSNELQITANGVGGATVTLPSSTRLRFKDVTVAYGTTEAAARVYRLYQAAFNRTPDLGGLGFWIEAMDRGTSLVDMANTIMTSEEFIGMYGQSISNADLVARFYYNVLQRQGDAGGLRYWIDVLDRKAGSRADVLAAFSESPENKARMLPAISNGIAYQEYGVAYDADNDGVLDKDDATPNDALCSAASDAKDGVCYVRTLAQNNGKVIGSAAGKVYFRSNEEITRLYAYDLQTHHFVGRVDLTGYTPTSYAYLPAHGRIYVGDSTGKIHSYSEAMQEVQRNFINVGASMQGITAAGNFLLAVRDGESVTFDQFGIERAQGRWWYRAVESEWSAAQSRLYSLSLGVSPADLHFSVIDQTSGKITSTGETPYHGAYTIMEPIRVNVAGTQVLLGSGDLYTAPELTWAGNLGGGTFSEAAWLTSGELLTFSASGAKTRMIRYSTSKTKVEELLLDGAVMHVAVNGAKNHIVLKKAGAIEVLEYVASDDSDRDGVSNLLDKFPFDYTAAVDSDNDGYPDNFLKDYTSADSPTGLKRDFYPQDASCYALEQGDGSNCNYGAVIPAFTPDKVLSDGAGTVFILSKANNRVYRWSQSKGDYISPLVIGQKTELTITAPTIMEYSAEHKRLYFGYTSGLITYIDVAGDSVESRFAAVATGVGGIASAGKYILVQDSSGAWSTHYIFDSSGISIQSKDWNYYSGSYAWNAAQSRIYFFRDSQSPNNLMYETIDQASGKITSDGETPYHGSYSIRGPIRVSPNGTRIVLGSGDLYGTADLKVVKSIGSTHIDAQWLDSGFLYTLAENGIDTKVSTYDTSLNYLKALTFIGTPKALLKNGTSLIVVTQEQGKPKFSIYRP